MEEVAAALREPAQVSAQRTGANLGRGLPHFPKEGKCGPPDPARGEDMVMAKTALVAVGGNSLIRAGEKGTIAEQLANTRRTAVAIVRLIRLGYRLVITHGNGPQVGAQLLRSERASDVAYSQTLTASGGKGLVTLTVSEPLLV